MIESIKVLRRAEDIQGNACIRELGYSIGYAIDTFGRKELQEEYNKVVQREVEYISNRMSFSQAAGEAQPGAQQQPSSPKQRRRWWPFG